MINKKLTPTQIKLKKVLKPIVEGILKEEGDLKYRRLIGDVTVDIYKNGAVKIKNLSNSIEINPSDAEEVGLYIVAQLKKL